MERLQNTVPTVTIDDDFPVISSEEKKKKYTVDVDLLHQYNEKKAKLAV